MRMKVCTHCRVPKPLDDFRLDCGKRWTGIGLTCLACRKRWRRSHRRYKDEMRAAMGYGPSLPPGTRGARGHHFFSSDTNIGRAAAGALEEVRAFFDHQCAFCDRPRTRSLSNAHLVSPALGGDPLAISNIVPACNACNLSMGRKPWEEWYKKREFFSVAKFGRILAHISINRAKRLVAA